MAEVLNLARVVAVQEDLVTIKMAESNPRPIVKNEVVYICPNGRVKVALKSSKPRCCG